jgi:hypothetical protein
MKNVYHCHQLVLPAAGKVLFAFCCMLFLPFTSSGQNLSLTMSATNNAPNNCTARTISVSVAGGSGNYAYFWSSSPSSNVNLGNGPSIAVSPSVGTTFTVAIWDNSLSLYAEKSIVVSPFLSGSLSYFIPNAFLEGNLWRVMDASKTTGPLNAYRYELSIIDNWGNQVFASSGTVSSGTLGLVGGEISWNGRLNGTGSYVPAGNYFYDLRLINCSTNTLLKATITFFRPLMLTVAVAPNPAVSYVTLELLQEDTQLKAGAATEVPVWAEIHLINLAGRVMLTETVSAFPAQLDVRALPEDEYMLVVRLGEHTIRKRLLVRR